MRAKIVILLGTLFLIALLMQSCSIGPSFAAIPDPVLVGNRLTNDMTIEDADASYLNNISGYVQEGYWVYGGRYGYTYTETHEMNDVAVNYLNALKGNDDNSKPEYIPINTKFELRAYTFYGFTGEEARLRVDSELYKVDWKKEQE